MLDRVLKRQQRSHFWPEPTFTRISAFANRGLTEMTPLPLSATSLYHESELRAEYPFPVLSVQSSP